METEFYIILDQEKKGPFTIRELTILNLSNDIPVWHSALSDWTTIGELRKNNPLFASIPPPFPVQTSSKKTSKFNNKHILFVTGILILTCIIVFNSINSNSDSSYIPSATDSMPAAGYNEKELELERIQQLTIKNRNYRNNWSEYVIAERSSYSYSGLGGIYNLSIFLTNKTDYKLAQVQVAVDYIKSAGGIYKTEYVVFENVKPESKMVLPAPNSDRGTKVEFRIYNIYAPSFHFCYDESNPVGNGSINDPWRCVQ